MFQASGGLREFEDADQALEKLPREDDVDNTIVIPIQTLKIVLLAERRSLYE